MPAFTYLGASGQTYTFELFNMEEPKAIPFHGGLVAYANYTPKPVFFAQAPNIHDYCTRSVAWISAKTAHKADRAYLLMESDEEKRRAILFDLVSMYDPAMNRGPQVAHRQLGDYET